MKILFDPLVTRWNWRSITANHSRDRLQTPITVEIGSDANHSRDRLRRKGLWCCSDVLIQRLCVSSQRTIYLFVTLITHGCVFLFRIFVPWRAWRFTFHASDIISIRTVYTVRYFCKSLNAFSFHRGTSVECSNLIFQVPTRNRHRRISRAQPSRESFIQPERLRL